MVADQCQFGSKWRKRTLFALIHVFAADPLDLKCSGKRGVCSQSGVQHEHIIGSAKSRVAAQYPAGLCDAGALVLSREAERRHVARFLQWV